MDNELNQLISDFKEAEMYDNTPKLIEIANKMEFTRLSSYGFTPTKEDYAQYYINDILNGKILVVTCYKDDKLVGGCYVSNSLNSL